MTLIYYGILMDRNVEWGEYGGTTAVFIVYLLGLVEVI